MRTLAIAIVAASFTAAAPDPAAAQSILVEVTASETGSPLSGAFVSLLDGNGQVLRSALTNEAGRALFPATTAVGLRVKAEVLDRRSQTSDPYTPRTGEQNRIALSLPIQAITLAGIRVEPEQRCRLRSEEALEIAHVWDAARKILEVQAWAERTGLHRLDITTYDRDLDAAGRKVEREARRARTIATRTPFASLPPADLIEGGFVRAVEDGGHQYYGPDAAVLLSDAFLDSHCFRIARSRDVPGAIGLAFEPVRTADFPDIAGTLWLDEQTARLRFLEFHYTWTPYEEAHGVAGGRVEFEALPDGAWIIDRWWIRAPIMARHTNLARAGDTGIRVAGVRETGGEVLGVSTSARRIVQAARGSLTGIVWDSTRAVPLAGAAVSLSGTAYAATSDSTGRFLIADLPAGVFTALFDHPRLDSLGIMPPSAEAEVIPGTATHLALAVPSTAAILLAACSEQVEVPGAVLSGMVSDRTRGTPIPGATVRIEGQDVERMRPTVQATDQWFEVLTDQNGRYTACSIPIDETVRIRAALLTYRSDPAEMEFADVEHRALDLAIELPAAVAAARSEVAGRAMEYGAQGVQGILTERNTGSPVRDAEITMRSLSGGVVANGVTNERGVFRLATPVPGRYLLSAETLGYGRLEGEAVDVSLGQLTVLEIQMVPAAVALEPLVVTAEPRAYHLEVDGFYRRMETGLGKFMTPEVFEQRKPRMASDLLFGIPGVNVAEPTLGAGGRAVYFRSGIRRVDENGISVCWPMIYVNRMLVSTGGTSGFAEPAALDELVHAADVLAMEVYRSPAEVQPEFSGPNSGCGVIVLWTRRGGSD
jgi:hypothetical protein